MAGRGPASTGRAIRRNKEQQAHGVITAEPTEQPELPALFELVQGRRRKRAWHPETQKWWDTWASSPLSAEFTDDDWTFLKDTALMHHTYWSGDLKWGPELRLRVAKFGQTPEDRQRLKIKFAPPSSEGENEKPKTGSSSRERRGALRVV